MSADRVFTFEELKGLNKKTDLHMLIDGKGAQMRTRLCHIPVTLAHSSPSCLQSTPLPTSSTRYVHHRQPGPRFCPGRTSGRNDAPSCLVG